MLPLSSQPPPYCERQARGGMKPVALAHVASLTVRQLSLRVVPAHPLPLSLITVADRRLQPTLSSQIFETELK